MSNQFKWEFDQEPDPLPTESSPQPGPGRRWSQGVLLVILLATAVYWLYDRNQSQQAALRQTVQTVLDSSRAALQAGDGERYFALQEASPDLIAAHLLPRQQRIVRAGQQVTNVGRHEDTLRANVTWQDAGHTYQRVRFFGWRGGQLRELATDPAYWGETKQYPQSWGTLVLHSADDTWATAVAAHSAATIARLCAAECAPDRLPLTLVLRSDDRITAAAAQLDVPSPRLIGLDESGQPSPRFWALLDERLRDYLTPATLRVAIPPQRHQRIDYAAAAAAFSRANPDIRIELIPLAWFTDAQDLAAFDVVALAPQTTWIAAGLVHDLTGFATTDPGFDQSDFYEQLWQGAVWRDRLWFMPLAADMPLLYYHRSAYDSLGLEEPSLRWTWAEMERDAVALRDGRLESGADLTWGYLDQTLSTLYAYAFNQQSGCQSNDIRPCPAHLTETDIANTLAWYAALIRDDRATPDVSELAAEDQRRLVINSLFETGIWVDSAVYYEHRALMFPMGVTTFPGSDRFDGSAPLWVRGAFISSQTTRPLAAWQWLAFLSDQPPMPRYRLIPARPSVARASGYWDGLPRPLSEPLRSAFPLARPVRLADQAWFSWEQVGQVAAGELTLTEAAVPPRLPWFTAP